MVRLADGEGVAVTRAIRCNAEFYDMLMRHPALLAGLIKHGEVILDADGKLPDPNDVRIEKVGDVVTISVNDESSRAIIPSCCEFTGKMEVREYHWPVAGASGKYPQKRKAQWKTERGLNRFRR